MKKIVHTDNAPKAIGPYAQAIDLGNMIFLSGQIPVNPETNTMPESVEEQATQCLKNIVAVLKEVSCSAANIVKTTIFLADLNDFDAVNKIYGQYFDSNNAPYPARSCVQVARIPKDAKVEIEVIAVR